MVKKIKSERVIKVFLKSLISTANGRFIDYESEDIRDVISIDVVIKKAYINIKKFPYYNKTVHYLVGEFLKDYCNYDEYKCLLLDNEFSTVVQIDELE